MEAQNNNPQVNPEQSDKVIFGLSPKATIINAIVISILSQLFWVISVASQISANPNSKEAVNVPWYYDMPLSILSILMVMKWIEHVYKIDKNDRSLRALRYRFVYGVCLTSVFQLFVKVILLVLVVYFQTK